MQITDTSCCYLTSPNGKRGIKPREKPKILPEINQLLVKLFAKPETIYLDINMNIKTLRSKAKKVQKIAIQNQHQNRTKYFTCINFSFVFKRV